MELKKRPKYNLENYSKLFTQLGLVLTLFIVYLLIESKTEVMDFTLNDHESTARTENDEQIVEYRVEKPKVFKPKPVEVPNIIEKTDDPDMEETILKGNDVDETSKVDIMDQFVDVDDEDPIIEDVLFINVEEVPTFPGCEGNNEERKACFEKKISKFIGRKFNVDLAQDLGLAPGKKRISVMFKIDKQGEVVDIRARAPHARLQKEAIRVIDLLPKMKPGIQGSRPVNVKYTLPIVFIVE